MLEEALGCGDTERCVKELQKVSVMCLQPRPQTLWAVAALLTSDDPDVMKAAIAFLSSAASHKPFRSKVSLLPGSYSPCLSMVELINGLVYSWV